MGVIMKKVVALFFVFVFCLELLPPVFAENISAENVPLDSNSVRGVWVSTVYNLDFPSKAGLTTENLKAEVISILNNLQNLSINTVFLQVRPECDAIYNSEIYPMSKYITGAQGKAVTGDFDLLTYWIAEAHSRNIKLHAWINPYRVSANGDLSQLATTNPALKNRQWLLTTSDNQVYFNPGIPAVTDLILSGIREILDNYSIDGIHFDDYFYPNAKYDDTAAYSTYGKNFKTIEDFRRNNVTELIRKTHNLCSSKEVVFGVAPTSIWQNKFSNPLGSDTNGFESYSVAYSDSRLWVKKGFVDYIIPEIYFEIGHENADYTTLINWWSNVCEGTNVKLYAGIGAYKFEASPQNIINELKLNESVKNVQGAVFFRYGFLKNEAIFSALSNYYIPPITPIPPVPPVIVPKTYSLEVTRPKSNSYKTSLRTFYIMGTSDASTDRKSVV